MHTIKHALGYETDEKRYDDLLSYIASPFRHTTSAISCMSTSYCPAEMAHRHLFSSIIKIVPIFVGLFQR